MEENEKVSEEVSGEKKSGNKMTIGMILIVVVVVAVIGVYFFLSNKTSSSPTMVNQETQTETTAVTPEESMQNMESTGSGSMENVLQEKNIKTVSIDGTEYSYTPSTINVNAGDQVHLLFTNKGKFPHNLDLPDLGISTKTINPGETDSIDFTAPKSGTYAFYCTVDSHKDKGMVGTLVVK